MKWKLSCSEDVKFSTEKLSCGGRLNDSTKITAVKTICPQQKPQSSGSPFNGSDDPWVQAAGLHSWLSTAISS